MNRFAKTAILTMAAVAVPLATASADPWGYGGWGGGPGYYHHHHRHHHGDAIAAGVVGLAAGALLGSALSQPAPVYEEPAPISAAPPPPPPVYYAAPPARVVYRSGYQPWSRAWYAYCSDRFRSFNPRTGTYLGLDGQNHFCTAN